MAGIPDTKCWLCSGEKPDCRCAGEDDDDVGGRPDGSEVWDPKLTYQVESDDGWMSVATALSGAHRHLASIAALE
jgi:hypothetical protein